MRSRECEEMQHIEVQSKDCVTRDTLLATIDNEECPAEKVPITNLTEYKRLAVQLFLDGEYRWVDRESEYLVGWGSFEDQQKPKADIDINRNCSTDPLEINLSHGAGRDGDYRHKIRISTLSHLWWADTDAGRLNGDRLLDFLGGLARLECITETYMFSNRSTSDFIGRLDHEFE